MRWKTALPSGGRRRRPHGVKRASSATRRRLIHEALEDRIALAANGPLDGDLKVRFEFTDSGGTPVESLVVDDQFQLNVYVQDVRTGSNEPTGVKQAYFDVFYQQDLVSTTGSLIHGPQYSFSPFGDTSTAGLIDEAGGADLIPPLMADAGDEFLLFTVPFQAEAPGTLELTADLSEFNPRLPLFHNDPTIIQLSDIDFICESIEIVSTGVLVSPTSGLTTTEAGGTDVFEVVLSSAPGSDVTFSVTSSNVGEGTVSVSEIEFTPLNWDIPQTITVTGQQDQRDDGDTVYSILTGMTTSSDPEFNNLEVADVIVTNLDDDTAGVQVAPVAGLTVTEAGGTDQFIVTLTAEPSGPVTIPLSSTDPGEGTVPASVQLDISNWNTGVTVTVTGQDDDTIDGDVGFTVLTGDPSSSDIAFDALVATDVADVAVTNQDLDTAGIVVSTISGNTREDGTTATFTVTLTSRPAATVSIPLNSSDTGEGTVPATVDLDDTNWNTGVTVVVTGQADDVIDGDVAYQIITGDPTSTDGDYAALTAGDVADVTLTNEDLDAAAVIVSQVSGNTREDGTTATFVVSLGTVPAAPVTVPLSSSDPGEGTVPTLVVLDDTNWDSGVIVTITGQDDDRIDGDVAYTIITGDPSSVDANFDALVADDVGDVAVINQDLDSAGIHIGPISGNTREDGTTATFTVTLTSAPSGPVTVPLASSDEGEGTVPASITLNDTNWDTGVTVTVTGQDDDLVDGNVSFTILTGDPSSSDANYDALGGSDVADVSVVNEDLDIAAIHVSLISGNTREDGTTATFVVTLTSQPAGTVTVPLSSDNPDEGTVPTSIALDDSNWNTGVTVTVTGQDDDLIDGDVAYSIVTGDPASGDASYDALGGGDVADVAVVNEDLDTAAVIVSAISGNTREDGTTADFVVRLASRPTSAVTIPLVSTDPAEVTAPVEIVLDETNWDTGVTVLVTGQDDDIVDGDVDVTIQTGDPTSSDADYDALIASDVADVPVINEDLDVASIVVSDISGDTGEDGTIATFTILLTSKPSATVTIPLSSSDPSEGTVPDQVELDELNWNTGVVVSVTGQDDGVVDGDIVYTIQTGDPASADINYDALGAGDVDDVVVTNADNDSAINITPILLSTSEDGTSAAFTVTLTNEPSGTVTIPLQSTNTNEGTVQANVVLDSSNWDTGVTVAVTGVDDGVVDGAVTFTVQTFAAISTDPEFDGIDPADISVVNLDNDTATLTITSVSASEGTGGSSTEYVFDVTLSANVVSAFTVNYATADATAVAAGGDYTAASGTLNFDGVAGQARSITVAVHHDAVVEGDETFNVLLSGLSGVSETVAARIMLPSAPGVGTISNDDTATLTITGPAPTQEGTGESDTVLTFAVQLSAEVQNGFTLAYATGDGTATLADDDYTDNDGTLVFSGDPNEIRMIDVVVRADDRIEDDETLAVTLGALSNIPATASDDITVATTPVSATIVNDDFPELWLSDVTATPLEGTGGTTTQFSFEVMLTDPITDADGFLVPFQIIDGTATVADGDYQDNDGALLFSGTEGEIHTITVQVNHDSTVEANETFAVMLGDPQGVDGGQLVLIPMRSVTATIENDDTATLMLAAAAAGQSEGSEFALTATLSAAVQGGFMVPFATADGTATLDDGDYSAAAGMLTFAGTAAESRTFTITTGQDAKVELDETVNVALQAITGLPAEILQSITIGGPLVLTLENEDTATVAIATPVPVAEGAGGSTTDLIFTVTLSAPVDGGFSIAYQTDDGTAEAASDYTDNDGSLTFAGAAESQMINVVVAGDAVVEADETVEVILGQLSGLLSGLENDVSVTIASSTGTISNDDTATLSITGPAVTNEGTGNDPTAFVFTVMLSAAVQDGLTIAYATSDGTATLADSDYTDNDGNLTFVGTAGETRQVTVNVTADDRVEPDEVFEVALGTISGLPATAADDVTVTPASAMATIANDDFARLVLSDVTASNIEGSDSGGTTEFTFTVVLTDAVDDPDGFTVPLSIEDGTAKTADGDYQDNDLVLSFEGTANETKTVTVLVNHDGVLESDETFIVQLDPINGLATGETVVIETSSVTATIVNDDAATLTLAALQTTASEGDSGATELLFDVTLSGAVQDGFSIAYATNDDTATVADGDYIDNDGILQFTGTLNETQRITVQINGDTKVELDELLEVALGALTNLDTGLLDDLTVAGSPQSVTISNDDAANLTISGPGTRNEGTGAGTTTFEFTVTLDNPVAAGFSLAFTTNQGTATVADGDFVDNDGALSFNGNAGETRTIEVLVNQDSRVESNETFDVTLGAISGLEATLAALVAVDTNPVIATIQDDDSGSISFSTAASDAIEANGQHAVAVQLVVSNGGTLSAPATVNVVVRAGGTASGNDFTLATGSIVFPAGSANGATRNVQLNLTEDQTLEEVETVVLGLELATVTGNVTLGTPDTHTVSITDDPQDAVISGRVWVDANRDSTLSIGELTVANVQVSLAGTSIGGESINRTTVSDADGLYRFADLPAGTYAVTRAMIDEMLATGDGTITVELSPSEASLAENFAEPGLRAEHVHRFRVLARPRTAGLFGNPVTAEMINQPTATVASSSGEGEAPNLANPDAAAVPIGSSPAEGEAGSSAIQATNVRTTAADQTARLSNPPAGSAVAPALQAGALDPVQSVDERDSELDAEAIDRFMGLLV